MEFRHLRYFLAVAEELHFGRAAQRLHISQPPLSLNIRQLEEELGVRLFERNSREVRLTAAGQAFEPQARKLLDQAIQAAQRAREAEMGVIGHLRIGFVGTSLLRGLPQAVRHFQRQYPRVRLSMRELNSSEQFPELAMGHLDLGFVHSARLPPELDRRLYRSESLMCCLPINHPQATRRLVDLRRLRDETFVSFARHVSPDYYERIHALCTDAGFKPEVVHEARQWMSVLLMVSQGMGVALVPEVMRNAGIEGVVLRPVAGATALSQTYCVWRRDTDIPALKGFLDCLSWEDARVPSARKSAAPQSTSAPPR